MPIYEYQCLTCGHQMEAFQGITEQALITCPHCNEPTLNKLISNTSFQLKGTGWYVTDIRDKGKSKPAESGETASKTTDNTKTSSSNDKATD